MNFDLINCRRALRLPESAASAEAQPLIDVTVDIIESLRLRLDLDQLSSISSPFWSTF
jgi:hypothetical protein